MHGVQNESPHEMLTPAGTGEMVCLLVAGCESWRAGIPVIVLSGVRNIRAYPAL